MPTIGPYTSLLIDSNDHFKHIGTVDCFDYLIPTRHSVKKFNLVTHSFNYFLPIPPRSRRAFHYVLFTTVYPEMSVTIEVVVRAADAAPPPPAFLSRRRRRPSSIGAPPPPPTLCRRESAAWPSWLRVRGFLFPIKHMKHQLSVVSSFLSVLVQLFVILIMRISTCCEILET